VSQSEEDAMTKRGLALAFTLAVVSGGLGCGYAEQGVVDQYFRATNAKEAQTVAGFALVGFDQKADKWSIESVDPATSTPAKLPDLEKKVQEADAAVAANVKAAKAYSMDHADKIDEVRSLQQKKGSKIPPNLTAVAAEWDKFNQNDRSLKKALAEAREAVQKEKDAVVLSVTERSDDVSTLQGNEVNKKVSLLVTIAGQAKNYVMTLRKYELHEEGKTQNRLSRWIVAGLEPKG
jgi:hypothetical protein